MNRLRIVGLGVTAALVVIVLGGVVGRIPSPSSVSSPASAPAAARDPGLARIERAQLRLRDVPGDWREWASLSVAYLERSRVTADPTWYPKAEEAARRSLAVRPEGNPDALVAQGGLANARHDFGTARTLALAAIAQNEYDAEAYAVLVDAETQLGRPVAATAALQRMLDLRPGLSSYTRASYDLELRGRTAEAADLMRRALAAAVSPADIAFCRNQLGDLALAAGDPAEASIEYTAGLRADPTASSLHRGQARVAAATGRLDDALRGYATLTARAPTPGNLIEHAELLRAAGREAEATARLRLAAAAHQLFTENGGIDGLVGSALALALGHPTEAVAQARAEWSRRQPAEVADALAWALHAAGNDTEALGYARLAVAPGARSASYAFHLGMIHRGLGDAVSAETELTRALALNPAFSPVDAPAARRALAELRS